MPSVSDLVSPDALIKLATPSNHRLGETIARDGEIDFLEFGPLKVVARVSGLGVSKRTVTLESSGNKLSYKCTCTQKPGWFCKHCVAAGIVTWEKSPGKKK